jgi:serine/threonine protein kinase
MGNDAPGQAGRPGEADLGPNQGQPDAKSSSVAEATQRGGLVGRVLGNYRLQSLLGVGGMADVYRADDLVLKREVAVKVLFGHLAADPGYVARFRDEARRVAALNHPHVVPVYTYGEATVDGLRLLYLVMPLLRESLRELLAREGRLRYDTATQLALQVAQGLAAAHALGLVHRDVKPENVLLDAEGRALLGDFGIAREVGTTRRRNATLAATGLPVGTPEYMAPEQLRGGDVDQRADLYALGAVLYELLTGVAPFEGETPYDVAAKVLNARLMPPSVQVPDVPVAIERVVLIAMARQPSVRYSTAADMEQALRDALAAPNVAVSPRTETPEPAIADQPTDIMVAAPSLPIRGTSPIRRIARAIGPRAPNRRARALLILALVATLVAASAGAVLIMLQPWSSSGAPRVSSSALGTAGALATTPSATLTPTPTQTSAPTIIALGIAPIPLRLVPSAQDTKMCVATQTITNRSGQRVGWSWQAPSVPGFQFRINGGAWRGWPSEITYIAPGGQDSLDVMGRCRPKGRSFAIVVKDTLGGQYHFTLTVPS